jgi:hypothetical protein
MPKFKRQGQSLTELALVIVVVTTAILGMQIYVRRGLQARYKAGMDYFFSRVSAAKGSNIERQYEPNYSISERRGSTESNVIQGYPSSSEQSRINQSGQSITTTGGDAD